MDTFAGLPAHPLLVHAPVVLVPVVALLVILMIVRPQWLERFGWLAVGLAGLALVTGVLAENSGEALEEAVEDSASRTLLHAHEEAGEKVPLLAFLLFASLVAWVGWQWWSRRKAAAGEASGSGSAGSSSARRRNVRMASRPRSPISMGLGAIALVVSLAATWFVYDAGHTGAKTAWDDVKVTSSEGEGDEGR